MWQRLKPLIVPLYFTSWLAYFAYFWSHLFVKNEAGDIVAQHVNVWGDWAAHFTMGSAFGYRALWLTESPFIADHRFSYPFITNWLAGILIRVEVPFLLAFVIPSFLCSCLLIFALYFFYKTVFSSTKKALLASLIFLLNGGLGFLFFLQDIATSATPWQVLLNPPHEYTRIDEQGIKWLSILDSMVIPQRAFALGFPLTVMALALLFQHFFKSSKSEKPMLWSTRTVVASLILGLMPLIHTHSFMAAAIILACWSFGDVFTSPVSERLAKLKAWALVAGVTGAIALPLYGYFFSQQVTGFIKWYPGWLASEFAENWLIFWLKNWGVTPFLAVLGFGYWLKTSPQRPQVFFWFVPFLVMFAAANLWLFQPFSWDNTKILVWAALGMAGLVTHLLVDRARTWRSSLAVGLLYVIIIASGTIDTYRLIRFDLHNYVMYNAEEAALAEWVKSETPATSRWLTSTQHNHWLFNLTGRQALMTYPGWLWTHGYDYQETEKAMKYLYAHPENKAAFATHSIEYVVIGPHEKSEQHANDSNFAEYHLLIKKTENYSLFSVTRDGS